MRILKKIYRWLFIEASKTPDKSSSFYKHAQVSSKAINRGAYMRLDNPMKDKIYLQVGDDTIFSGGYIFESQEGEIKIGKHSYIGDSMFISRSSIEIGDNVTIAWGCTIYDHDSHSLNYSERRKDIDQELLAIRLGKNFIYNKNWDVVNTAPIKICDDAWLGMDVLVLKGVTIGEGAVVAARSVVTKDVPPFTLVAGNPARVIKSLK